MSIFTNPVFYYDFTVSVNDIYINLDEGLGEITTTVAAGYYSFEELADAVAIALNSVGSQTYSLVRDRVTRKYTITALNNFSLLFGSGSNAGLSISSVIGFNTVDKSGSNSYTSDNVTGKSFSPQYQLQNFVSFDDYEEFSQASINESASGIVEVYSIGKVRFMEFNITPITNNVIGDSTRNNPNAVSEARDFLRYCTTKGDLEIMYDENDTSIFSTIKLEKTPTSSTGTGYKLNELYGRGLIGFFESGKLKFREIV